MADTTPKSAEPKSADPDLATQVRDLQNTIAAMRAGAPLSLIPEHSAGLGDGVAETWSQYDQEMALAGEHPDQ